MKQKAMQIEFRNILDNLRVIKKKTANPQIFNL